MDRLLLPVTLKMSVLATVLLSLAATFPRTAPLPLLPVSEVGVVADATCPVVIERVTLQRTSTGIVLLYSVRNTAKDPVRAMVLTAAGVDWAGTVKHIQLVSLGRPIPVGATTEQRAEFESVELSQAEAIVIGVQAIQWKGRRAEWRGVLKLNAPVALGSR